MKTFKDPLDTSFEVKGAYVNARNAALSYNSVDHVYGQCNAEVFHFLVVVLVT